METTRIQYLAIAGSILLFVSILFLIRQKHLKEKYSLLWLFFCIIFIVFSFWRKGLDWISDLIGVAYPPAALFLLLLMAIFFIMIEYSVIISRQSEWIKKMGQDVGLLKMEIEQLKKKNKES